MSKLVSKNLSRQRKADEKKGKKPGKQVKAPRLDTPAPKVEKNKKKETVKRSTRTPQKYDENPCASVAREYSPPIQVHDSVNIPGKKPGVLQMIKDSFKNLFK